MDAEITLKYGEETKTLSIRGASSIETLLPRQMTEIQDLGQALLKQ